MFGSTMVLTIGRALERAYDEGLPVRLCLGGGWVSGRVLSSDGVGVALVEANGDLCVFRLEAISGVRLLRSNASGSARAEDDPEHEQSWVPAQQHDRLNQRELATS